MTGQTISHYRILEKLGEGGMGVVYKAEDSKLRRTVALKFLPPHAAENRERFLREAQAAAALNHPNICTVFEIDDEHGFLAMELVEGQSLKDKISARPLPLEEALDIAMQACAGLQAAHEKGVVHRDIKPANLMVTLQGQVKIMDFGLAQVGDRTRITKTGASLGTPAYMSPEQYRSEAVDHRSDLWSLGVVLYEMLAGKLPLAGVGEAAVMYAVLHNTPEPITALRSGLPVALDRVMSKLLAKDPGARYQHASDLAVDLGALQQGAPPPIAKRSRIPYVAAAAIALLALAYFAMSRDRAAPASPMRYEQITAFTDSATQPALSADGRMVTFIRGPGTFATPGQIYVKLLPGGQPTQLTRDSYAKMSPVFSPDGSRIAYTVVTQGMEQWDTWVVPTLGGEARRWLPNASGLLWSAPGRLLFSEIKHGIHMAIASAAETRNESRDLYTPADDRGMMHRSYPSPDGKWILGAEMDRYGWIPCRLFPADGSSPGRLAGPAPGACTFAAWSPDGRWMYFTSDASGGPQIWRQRFPDGAPEQVTSGPAVAGGIAVAPDGRSLITSIGMDQFSVWIDDNGARRQVSPEGDAILPFFGDGLPNSVFSPDGKRLYYLIHRGPARAFGGGELWVADLAAGTSEALLPGLTIASFDISLDGATIVYSVVDEKRKSRLWEASTDRRWAPRQLPPNEGMGPVFGGRGNVFFRAPDGALDFIYELSLNTGLVRRAISEPAINAPTVSPDGEWIVTVVPAPDPEVHAKTMAYPRRGGQPLDVCKRCFVKWPADRRSIFLTFGAGSFMSEPTTWVVALAPGRPFPALPPGGIASEADLARLPLVRRFSGVQTVFPGPTASLFAFGRPTVQRNLYRIPLP